MSAAPLDNARRGFLRQLCSLPMIGGGVTLIGAPSAVAAPVTREILDDYATWLNQERRWLAWERADGDREAWAMHMAVQWQRGPGGRFDHKKPLPSSRAALVLSAVGVPIDPVLR